MTCYVHLERTRLRLTTAIDLILGVGAAVVIAAWLAGHPILYSTSAPVMSPFTVLSLFVMVAAPPVHLAHGAEPGHDGPRPPR